MKHYQGQMLERIVCNGCGKEVDFSNEMAHEDVYAGRHTFGYFSKMDGTQVEFDLCEACFLELLKGFAIPAKEIEKTELC